MKNTTYVLRFSYRDRHDSIPYGEREYSSAKEAWSAFQALANQECAQMYVHVNLAKYSNDTESEESLAWLGFETDPA